MALLWRKPEASQCAERELILALMHQNLGPKAEPVLTKQKVSLQFTHALAPAVSGRPPDHAIPTRDDYLQLDNACSASWS